MLEFTENKIITHLRAVHVRITAVYPRTDVQVQARSIVFKGGGGRQTHPKTVDTQEKKYNHENPNLWRGVYL